MDSETSFCVQSFDFIFLSASFSCNEFIIEYKNSNLGPNDFWINCLAKKLDNLITKGLNWMMTPYFLVWLWPGTENVLNHIYLATYCIWSSVGRKTIKGVERRCWNLTLRSCIILAMLWSLPLMATVHCSVRLTSSDGTQTIGFSYKVGKLCLKVHCNLCISY